MESPTYIEIHVSLLKKLGYPNYKAYLTAQASYDAIMMSDNSAYALQKSLKQLELTYRYLQSVCSSCVRNFEKSTREACSSRGLCMQYFESFMLEYKFIS